MNSLISEHGVYITYQSLSTLDEIGYLIVDFTTDKEIAQKLLEDLRVKESTIKVRLI